MKTSAHDHLQSILTQRGTPLEKIFAAYQAHQKIETEFQKDLPKAYENQVKLLTYRGGVMTISVKSSSLFSRLNYTKDSLLTHFKQKSFWASLRKIEIKISTSLRNNA